MLPAMRKVLGSAALQDARRPGALLIVLPAHGVPGAHEGGRLMLKALDPSIGSEGYDCQHQLLSQLLLGKADVVAAGEYKVEVDAQIAESGWGRSGSSAGRLARGMPRRR